MGNSHYSLIAKIEAGDEEGVKSILESAIGRPDLTWKHPNTGMSILHYAATGKARKRPRYVPGTYVKIIDHLVKAGADINSECNITHGSPLHYAINAKCFETVDALIQRGANVDQCHPFCTYLAPILHAALMGDWRICELLVNAGCALDVYNHFGDSPLAVAIRHNKGAVAQYLLSEIGTSMERLNTTDEVGCTPLHLAMKHTVSPTLFQSLLAGKANLNAKDRLGRTPLLAAAYSGADDDAILMLLLHKASVEAVDRYGNSASHVYALRPKTGDTVIQHLLLTPQERKAMLLQANAQGGPHMEAADEEKQKFPVQKKTDLKSNAPAALPTNKRGSVSAAAIQAMKNKQFKSKDVGSENVERKNNVLSFLNFSQSVRADH